MPENVIPMDYKAQKTDAKCEAKPWCHFEASKALRSGSSPTFSACGRAQQKVKLHFSWTWRQIKPSGVLIFSISPLVLACFWFSSCLCFAFHIVSTHILHTAKKNTQINLCLNKQILNQSFTYKWCQGFKLFHLLLYACRVHFASGWGIQSMDLKATVTQQPLQPQMLLLPIK